MSLLGFQGHVGSDEENWMSKLCSIKTTLSTRECSDKKTLQTGENDEGEIRLALNILVILAPMMFFGGTLYCITAFEAYCSHCIKIPLVIDLIIGYAPYFAATVNPIIYIFLTRSRRKILRKAIFRLFGSRARLRENQTNSSLLSVSNLVIYVF